MSKQKFTPFGERVTARLTGGPMVQGSLDTTPENVLRAEIRRSTRKYEQALLRLRKARKAVRTAELAVREARRDMRGWLDCITGNGAAPAAPAPTRRSRGKQEAF